MSDSTPTDPRATKASIDSLQAKLDAMPPDERRAFLYACARIEPIMAAMTPGPGFDPVKAYALVAAEMQRTAVDVQRAEAAKPRAPAPIDWRQRPAMESLTGLRVHADPLAPVDESELAALVAKGPARGDG